MHSPLLLLRLRRCGCVVVLLLLAVLLLPVGLVLVASLGSWLSAVCFAVVCRLAGAGCWLVLGWLVGLSVGWRWLLAGAGLAGWLAV